MRSRSESGTGVSSKDETGRGSGRKNTIQRFTAKADIVNVHICSRKAKEYKRVYLFGGPQLSFNSLLHCTSYHLYARSLRFVYEKL